MTVQYNITSEENQPNKAFVDVNESFIHVYLTSLKQFLLSIVKAHNFVYDTENSAA